MIPLTQGELLKTQKLWMDSGMFIESIMTRLIQEYERQITVGDTEWAAAKQSVEYLAKKQALIDFKKTLTSYEYKTNR